MKCSKPNSERLERRKYTPHDIDLCDWKQVERIFRELQERPIQTCSDLERYYLDVCDWNSALTEEYCRIQLAASQNTSHEEARERFAHFNSQIAAPASEWTTNLDNRFLDSPYRDDLDPDRYGQLVRLLKNGRDLFRTQNIPLVVKDSEEAANYNALSGGLIVEFEGEKYNLSEISRFMEYPDRDRRREAWLCAAEVKLEHVPAFNKIYDQMIQNRTQMAKQADFGDFRDYQHHRLNRFDYSPIDCEKFHDVIEKVAVPAFLSRLEKRKNRMNLQELRPWDFGVDPDGRKPLQPFNSTNELVSGCATILDRVYPRLGDTLRLLQTYGNLDLETRQNKAPVGFNMPLDETGVSFIFMNATGQHRDVVVLLHESGHAIETKACIADPILQYRHTPQEWGECASQSMELLGMNHLDVFYPDPEDQKRCIIDKWESILISLIHTARIDAFQHWVYTHPTQSAGQRADKWMELLGRFPTGADINGLEHFVRWGWQSIPHLFIVPFYYIEYGIANLGAIQVYQQAQAKGYSFLDSWLKTMKLGYSCPIPDLYEKAGLTFAMHGDLAVKLVQFVSEEIDRVES